MFQLAALIPLKFKMEDYVKSKLNTKTLKKVGTDSGCCNSAGIYETDNGKVFIKYNSRPEADIMFNGEFESLKQLSQSETVKVPKPLLVGNSGKKWFIVMEYVNFKSLSKYSSQLGTSLAQLHLNNIEKIRKKENDDSAVYKFGFSIPTACGYIPQNNDWCDDWVQFYTKQKLEQQVDLIVKNEGNREINELWSQLQLKIPSFFKEVEVHPSLLHGDLWIGNCGESTSDPVIFDPASFYGHHEYDLAIAAMFGGFDKRFFDSYHKLIPKEPGFKERHQLYLLFHHLNHWNHFGSHRESSLQIMRKLVKL